MIAVDLHLDAEEELRQAVAWYDTQRLGLGDEFLDGFVTATNRVRENPLMYAEEERDGIRLCPITRFPFAVVYILETERIWVVAVADQRRRPRYWQDRIRS